MSEDLVNGALAECVVHAATDAFPTSPGIGGAPCVGTAEVEHYLSAVFRPLAATERASSRADDSAAEATYEILTHRRFCALSRGRASHYREAILGRLATKVRDSAPLEFWYDIGPGYHASLAPGRLPTTFAVELGEYLMLAQVSAFLESVGSFYRPGAHFTLVVDNLCGLHTNGIAVGRTERYCRALRGLITEMGLAERVSVFVESEAFDAGEYRALLREADEPPPLHVSAAQVENVERFLGRQ